MWGWLSDSELSELLAEENRGGREEARGLVVPCPAREVVVREVLEEESEDVLLMVLVPLGSVFIWG